jgi:1-aminocyclopropane-1-carboxylate deaminase
MTDSAILKLPSPVQQIHSPLLKQHNINLFVKRDDLIHPEISGNKWRKLKYNLLSAQQKNKQTLLTFGGAYSNHIHATAAVGKYFNFNTIGIIRGEEYQPLNPTLNDASNWGMQLDYVTRKQYRLKNSAGFINNLEEKYGDFYLIPEGGNNELALQGCAEILDELEDNYHTICVDCGTGATLAGMISGVNKTTQLLGFSVLKNADFLYRDINELLAHRKKHTSNNWAINLDYHFGGFAKTTPELFKFIKTFKKEHDIQLEPVYTGKMFYGIFELIKQGHFKSNSKILVIHTGGLQGLRGYKELI